MMIFLQFSTLMGQEIQTLINMDYFASDYQDIPIHTL